MCMKKKNNNIKDNISIVKSYLIESFYINPHNKYTIKKINIATNVN